MDFGELILLVISFAPLIVVAILAMQSCIKALKPVETPNLRIENMMKDADTEHYTMNDVELKTARKAVKFANQKPIIIAGCLWICVLTGYYICNNLFDEDMGKFYVVVACVAYGLFFTRPIRRMIIFKRDRDQLAKKKAYILDETMTNFSYIEKKGKNRYGMNDATFFDVIVGIADAGGSPVAFKTRLHQNNYYTVVDDKKQCDAILYKGQLVAVCNLEN